MSQMSAKTLKGQIGVVAHTGQVSLEYLNPVDNFSITKGRVPRYAIAPATATSRQHHLSGTFAKLTEI
jgi:hypothetical protein